MLFWDDVVRGLDIAIWHWHNHWHNHWHVGLGRGIADELSVCGVFLTTSSELFFKIVYHIKFS